MGYQRRVHGILRFIFILVRSVLINIIMIMSHPISLGIIIIIMALNIGLWAFYIYSWFIYLLVLVFLGGVIVLIIYMSTLSANEKFSPNNIYLGTLLFCTPIIFSNSNLLVSVNIRDNVNIITHMYESKNVSILSYLMIYLLITLVCVVKLVKFEDGPLIKRL